MRFSLILAFCCVFAALTQAADWPVAGSKVGNCTYYEFDLNGKTAKVMVPGQQAPGKPWLFRTVYWRAFPNSEDVMLQKGWAVAWIQTNDRFGTPADNAQRLSLYEYLVNEQGFSPKPVVFGMSYGGLASLRWAITNPDKICGIYIDAPVCNFMDWKTKYADCWNAALNEYGMTEEELLNGDGNPCIAVRKLAERKIPMLLICGDADKTVIFTEHGQKLAENFRAAGGDLEMHVKPGCDHHPHGLADPTPVVEFYEKCWKNAQ